MFHYVVGLATIWEIVVLIMVKEEKECGKLRFRSIEKAKLSTLSLGYGLHTSIRQDFRTLDLIKYCKCLTGTWTRRLAISSSQR